jgi:hypothetical protein
LPPSGQLETGTTTKVERVLAVFSATEWDQLTEEELSRLVEGAG